MVRKVPPRLLMSPEMFEQQFNSFEIPTRLITELLAGEPQIITLEHVGFLAVIQAVSVDCYARGITYTDADLARAAHITPRRAQQLLRELEAIGIISYEEYEEGRGIKLQLPKKGTLRAGARQKLVARINAARIKKRAKQQDKQED